MNAKKSGVHGKLTDVPVFLEHLETQIGFVLLQNVPFDLVVGRPTLKRLGGVLDFRSEEARWDYRGQAAALRMGAEYSQSQLGQDGIDSEDFTSDSDGDISASEGKGREEKLFLVIVDGKDGIERWQEACKAVYHNAMTREELRKKLFHLSTKRAE